MLARLQRELALTGALWKPIRRQWAWRPYRR